MEVHTHSNSAIRVKPGLHVFQTPYNRQIKKHGNVHTHNTCVKICDVFENSLSIESSL